ncbi:MAG TPA: hypothetical protein P5137_18105, partial [Candidatus Brocadiia bacterium]|nr:hypothetical protein [Candidatus Brocadiia bacterium]
MDDDAGTWAELVHKGKRNAGVGAAGAQVGRAGLGAGRKGAGQEKGAFAIGYNTPTGNAAPKAYLTAPLFNWATFYTSDVQSILDGNWTSRAYWEGLDKGMVSLDEITAN